ncbi:hypothetical protein D3C71_1918630 [compost metagenome]
MVIKITHTEQGIVVEPEIHAPANGHCQHEMMFATSSVEATCDAAKELNEMFNKFKNKYGENKNVH